MKRRRADLGALPVTEILEVFRRINSTNYALNAMEVHNARFDGEFKEVGETIAAHSLFEESRFFSTVEIRRMSDTKFCLTLTATLMGGYFNRDDDLEKYLENYNADFDQKEEIVQQFNSVADFIQRCNFDLKTRVWKKSDLFTLIVELHRALFKRKLTLSPDDVGARLKAFYNCVDSAADSNDSSNPAGIYYKAALAASNDRGTRVKRGEILQSQIDPTYVPWI